MLKELIEKRTALIAEYDAIKKASVDEKRSAYTNEEREKINSIKLDLDAIDQKIADEKVFEEKRNAKIEFNAPNIITNKKDINEFRSFLESGTGKFTISLEEVEKRAAITTSTNSHFGYVDQAPAIVQNEPELVLPSFGVSMQYFDSAVDVPAFGSMSASFGTEDNANSDSTLSSGKVTLSPAFVSASLELSKVFIQNSKQGNIEKIKNDLVNAIYKAIELRALTALGALSALTYTGSSIQGLVLAQEAAIVGSAGQGGYIFSRTGTQAAKASKIDAGSGQMVWTNGMVNGYQAKRSALASANHVYFGDFQNAVSMAMFGNGIEVEVISDSTLARKGNVLLIVSGLADAKVADSTKVSVFKTVNTLS
jgi:hypothetical protein